MLACAGAALAHPYPVLQMEMRNTLQPGDEVLTDPLLPALFGYGRGDVVMVRLGPSPSPDDLVSAYRVIGLPGDTVDLRAGHVVVNGRRLEEPYVRDGVPTDPEGSGPEGSGQTHWVVPAGSLFVLGDERAFAADSRVYGAFPLANVVGRAWLRCWPLRSIGFLSVP